MSLPKNERELEDKKLLELVGKPATRENIQKMKHGGSTGVDGAIKSVVTWTEMNEIRNRCPRYYRKRYVIIGVFTAMISFGVYNFIDYVLYSTIKLPLHSFIGNAAGALVTAIWVIFILDIRQKKPEHEKEEMDVTGN